MKIMIKTVAIAFAMMTASEAAITLAARNFTGPSVGVALVDGSGALLPAGSAFWQAGTFSSGFDFNRSASEVLAGFTSVSSIGGLGPFSGVFNNTTTFDGGNTGAPGPFTGQDVYIVVGNAADIASSTLIAVFNPGTTFIAGDIFGNGAQTADAELTSKVIYGIVGGAPAAQPNPAFSFTSSVQLSAVPIPEPSVALLGALGMLGLIRRRR